MATTITLEGAARTEFGKGAARRMRVANLIPATVYAGRNKVGDAHAAADEGNHPVPASHQRSVHHQVR